LLSLMQGKLFLAALRGRLYTFCVATAVLSSSSLYTHTNSHSIHTHSKVKAEEDLYLTGTETTIRRVVAETNYSCLMLKTQRFSRYVTTTVSRVYHSYYIACLLC
jgi:hypothetical protein